jgi:hypothetical protein
MMDEEQQKRLRAASSAVGSVQAEGLAVGSETLADLKAWVSGEVTIVALIRETLDRVEAKYGTPAP